jgi:hypothetical protein
MLFRTVYGPELASVYFYVQEYGPSSQKDLFDIFGAISSKKKSSPTNIEDALGFLEAAEMLNKNNQLWSARCKVRNEIGFKIEILNKLRSIQTSNNLSNGNLLDRYFIEFIDLLFIKPNVAFNNELHSKINSIDIPLPCSDEKVNAWRRVLEYLNVGTRAYGGLSIIYSEELVKNILSDWEEKEGPLQMFLEQHFDKYLPWKTKKGDVCYALANTFYLLESRGVINLSTKQDLPSKSYLGTKKIKWIERMDI